MRKENIPTTQRNHITLEVINFLVLTVARIVLPHLSSQTLRLMTGGCSTNTA